MIKISEPQVTDEEVKAVEKVLRSKTWTQGKKVEEFEDKIADYVGCNHVVAVNSATSALYLVYKGLGVRDGVTVTVPAITYPATSNAVIEAGGSVVFQHRHMLIGDFCVPVHLAGVPQPAYGQTVVEDASHALGSEERPNVMVGKCWNSQAAVFSTHSVKNVATGEGGLICTNNEKLAGFCRAMRSHGFVDGALRFPGYNMRMTDIQAALGIVQLKRIDKMRSIRQEIVDQYNDALVGKVMLPLTRPCKTFWHLYIVHTNKKVKLAAHLEKKGIQTRTHYPPVYGLEYYRRIGFAPIPEAEEWAETHLSLPLHCNLTQREINKVIEEVKRGVK